MTEPSQSALLTERVSTMSWEELQSASLSGGPAAKPQDVDGISAAAPSEDRLTRELADAIVPMVAASLKPQVDLAIEAAFSNAATRMRRDLEKSLSAAVKIAVEEALREKLGRAG